MPTLRCGPSRLRYEELSHRRKGIMLKSIAAVLILFSILIAAASVRSDTFLCLPERYSEVNAVQRGFMAGKPNFYRFQVALPTTIREAYYTVYPSPGDLCSVGFYD